MRTREATSKAWMAYLTRKLDSRSTSGARAATVLVHMGRHLEFAARCGGATSGVYTLRWKAGNSARSAGNTQASDTKVDQDPGLTFKARRPDMGDRAFAVLSLACCGLSWEACCHRTLRLPARSSTSVFWRKACQGQLAASFGNCSATNTQTPILQDFESDIKAVATSASDKKH